jgi:hypothetical protein
MENFIFFVKKTGYTSLFIELRRTCLPGISERNDWCRGLDSNQHSELTPHGPEPCASTNFATSAYIYFTIKNPHGFTQVTLRFTRGPGSTKPVLSLDEGHTTNGFDTNISSTKNQSSFCLIKSGCAGETPIALHQNHYL